MQTFDAYLSASQTSSSFTASRQNLPYSLVPHELELEDGATSEDTRKTLSTKTKQTPNKQRHVHVTEVDKRLS
jgi:hypothetical protein